jgi:hypothetical protein
LTCDNANPKSHSELLFILKYLAKSFSSIVSSCVESQETRLRENDTSKIGFNQINKHLTEGDKANQSFQDFVEIVCDICGNPGGTGKWRRHILNNLLLV